MDRLVNAVELLDGPLDDLGALAGNLRDLRRVNHFLGGAALSIRALERLIVFDRELLVQELRVLDVGTGAADIPLAILTWARRRAIACHVTAIDQRAEVLEAARLTHPGLRDRFDLELVAADGRSLPYPDGAFDVAHTSLLLHHLEPLDAVALLAELRRVSRLGVIVNDLRRARVHWIGAWLLAHLVTANRFTRHDAPLSVRRAYTPDEVANLLAAARLEPIAEIGGLLGHRFAIAARGQPEPGASSSVGAARRRPPDRHRPGIELEEPQ